MRKRLTLGMGAGVVAVAIGASPVGTAFANALIGPPAASPGAAVAADHPVRPAASEANPTPADPAVAETPQVPTLDRSQLDAVRAAVNADPFLKGITRGNKYTVANVTPWTEKASETMIGAELTLTLASPVNATTDLPAIRFAEGTDESYTKLALHARVSNVTALTVMVDLRSGAVVSVQPDDDAVVTELPGNAHYEVPAKD